MKNNQIRLVSTKAATKDDLQATLEYVRDVLETAQLLQNKMDMMPEMVRSFMQESGWSVNQGIGAKLSLVASKIHIENAIEQL